MTYFLLLSSSIIFLCVLLNKVSSKIGIPMLLGFIILGMFFGSDGIFKIEFDDFSIAEQICSVALIFIMFYGGFGTNWSAARPTALKAGVLASAGVVLTAGFTGLFCYFVLRFNILESFLIGAVTSSTDAASVFSILRSKRLNLKYNTASLLEVESGSNDPFSYMLTMVVLFFMKGAADGWRISYMLFAQIAYGAVFGVAVAYGALFVLRRFHFASAGFNSLFVVAVAVISYALPSAVGGNGYLSAYIAGIILGNKQLPDKPSLVNFFDGITGFMQMLIFFLLGLLAVPSKMTGTILPAFFIALCLTFISRPLSIAGIMVPLKSPLRQQALVSWAGLRGAASIVFAIMATAESTSAGFVLHHDIFHIVFCVVLFSIALQGSLIPAAARMFGMIDNSVNVLKTFTDYQNEVPIRFINVTVGAAHLWANKHVKDITLPPETLLVLITRGDSRIIPRGMTEIKEGDRLMLGSCVNDSDRDTESSSGIELYEVHIDHEHEWLGHALCEISVGENRLAVLIKRDHKVMIPTGRTVIKEHDDIVIENHTAITESAQVVAHV